jgi:hypothetical protein
MFIHIPPSGGLHPVWRVHPIRTPFSPAQRRNEERRSKAARNLEKRTEAVGAAEIMAEKAARYHISRLRSMG